MLDWFRCKLGKHVMVDDDRLRLVVLTDNPWLDFIDGLPAGQGTKCQHCGLRGVRPWKAS